MEEKAQGQSGAVLELEQAIGWFHQQYGSDLPAFFRDTVKANQSDTLRVVGVSVAEGKTLAAGASRLRAKRKSR